MRRPPLRPLVLGLFLCGVAFPAAASETLPITPASISIGREPATGQRVVSIELAPDAAKALAAFTAKHVGRELELRIDGKMAMRAVLREPIAGGRIQVSGPNTEKDFPDLSERAAARRVLIEVEALGD
jgi:preprotein translocase subunit SecD